MLAANAVKAAYSDQFSNQLEHFNLLRLPVGSTRVISKADHRIDQAGEPHWPITIFSQDFKHTFNPKVVGQTADWLLAVVLRRRARQISLNVYFLWLNKDHG